jgi:hypothetical protein
MEFVMLKQFILGGVALAIVGGVAFAETAATPGPAAPADLQVAAADNAPPPPPAVDPQNPDDNQGWWGWGKHRHGGRHGQMGMNGPMGGPGGPGMMGGHGGPGMMMNHQGFRLTLGEGISVNVMCGKEVMKDCIAEAQPLIDAAKAAAATQPAPAAKTP